MPVTVKQVGNPSCLSLGSLAPDDSFIESESGFLYIRVRNDHRTPSDTRRCLRLTPDRGVAYLPNDLRVRPVDINIEWEFTC